MSRKLDAALAEALGHEVTTTQLSVGGKMHYMALPNRNWKRIPCYSAIARSMLRLDKEMQTRGWQLQLFYSRNTKKWVANYRKDRAIQRGGIGAEMPFAVALAAYHALTGKEWTE